MVANLVFKWIHNWCASLHLLNVPLSSTIMVLRSHETIITLTVGVGERCNRAANRVINEQEFSASLKSKLNITCPIIIIIKTKSYRSNRGQAWCPRLCCARMLSLTGLLAVATALSIILRAPTAIKWGTMLPAAGPSLCVLIIKNTVMRWISVMSWLVTLMVGIPRLEILSLRLAVAASLLPLTPMSWLGLLPPRLHSLLHIPLILSSHLSNGRLSREFLVPRKFQMIG